MNKSFALFLLLAVSVSTSASLKDHYGRSLWVQKSREWYQAQWAAKQRAQQQHHAAPAPKPAAQTYSAPAPTSNPGSGQREANGCQRGVPKIQNRYCQCMYETDKPGGWPLPSTISTPYYDDAIRVRVNGQVINGVTITDPLGSGIRKAAAHRDAIQLIPTMPGVSNYQFIGGMMKGVKITNNRITSAGKLQGVFASDGLFTDLIITNNIINTNSDHKVTINGFMTGKISGNKDSAGRLAHVELGPCRIGGNFFTGNVWVLGFHSSEPRKYSPLSQIIGDGTTSHVVDKRTTVARTGDCNVKQFRVTQFHKDMTTMTVNDVIRIRPTIYNKFNKWMQNLAAARGREGASSSRIATIRTAWAQERGSIIVSMKNQDLRNFVFQELTIARSVPVDASKCN